MLIVALLGQFDTCKPLEPQDLSVTWEMLFFCYSLFTILTHLMSCLSARPRQAQSQYPSTCLMHSGKGGVCISTHERPSPSIAD
ncbi:hypothetical protein ABKN59_011295 [Abortiporus biennis]